MGDIMKLTKNIEEANLITHSGNFHADDIFATVFMSKIIKNPVLYRLNNYTDDIKTDAIIYDIGGGKFDHHQVMSDYREDGITKYSSVGLLWREFGREYLKTITDTDIEFLFNEIDNNLIYQIDAIDNGQFPTIESNYKVKTLSDIISMYNPNWNNQDKMDECFMKAFNFANEIFDLEINKLISKQKAEKKVEEEISKCDGQILVLKEFMPFKDFILESKNPLARTLKFVIFPSQRGGYTIHTIPKSKLDRTPRLSFNNSWCGLRDKELQQISGIESAIFVHPDGFIGGANTLEDSIKMAKKTIYVR